MLSFFIQRLAYGILVLFAVTVIVSGIVHLTPVDPTRLTFGQRMDEKTVELKRKQLGLDRSFGYQVTRYISDVSPLVVIPKTQWRENYNGFKVSLGSLTIGLKRPYLRESYQSGRSVGDIIRQAFPNTLYLASASLLLALIIGIVSGIVAALFKETWIDRIIIILSTVGYSVPSYVTAIVLAVVFGYYLRSYTGLNIQGSLFELNDVGDDIIVLKNLLLPCAALGIRPVSIITQLMRSSMLQVMDEKYVLAARAKGLNKYQLIKDHMLKNAMNPVLTALSGWFAALLAGAFFVEFIFNFKGLGFVTVNALLNYDIPVILGTLLFTCSLFILINILVDVLYKVLDPRIQL